MEALVSFRRCRQQDGDVGVRLLKVILELSVLAIVIWQGQQLLLGRASRKWRTTRGKVLRSYVDDHLSHDRCGGEHVSYSAKVEYTYHVGSQHFTSQHLTYEPTIGLSEDAVTALL